MNSFYFYHYSKTFVNPVSLVSPASLISLVARYPVNHSESRSTNLATNPEEKNLEENQQSFSQPDQVKSIAIWETCLRKIIFTDSLETVVSGKNLDLYEDEEALTFMLEVLCGLQSKVIGETEIFGQFKQFLETEEAKKISFFRNQQFVQFLFKQVKEIREKYITQLGVNSYGAMIRKICQSEDEISLIGYGQLAKKILPWLGNHKVKIHVRDKSKYQNQKNIQFLNLNEMGFFSTLIIAAPVKTEQIVSLIQSENPKTKTDNKFTCKPVHKIVDCRSLEEQEQSIKQAPQAQKAEVVDLNDLFANAEAKQQRMKSLLPLINQEICQRVRSYLLKAQHRPQGWEDLCG